jgi:hypothetical protein
MTLADGRAGWRQQPLSCQQLARRAPPVTAKDGLAWCETCNGSTETGRVLRIATMITDPEYLLTAFVLFVIFLIMLAAAVEGFWGISSAIARLLGRCFSSGSAGGSIARRPAAVAVRRLRGLLVRLCTGRRLS